MNYRTLQVLFILLLNATPLHAEETPADIAQRAYLANINALMIFTSQDGLNSGHYRFTNIGIKLDIYHLPFLYQLDIGNEVIYSRSGVTVNDPDNDIGDAIGDFFTEKYNDNLTYKFLLQLEHHREINGHKLYVKLNHKLYETKADFNVNALTSFTTQASVTSMGSDIETPALFSWRGMYLTLEGYLYGHYMTGDIVDIVGFDTYSTVAQ